MQKHDVEKCIKKFVLESENETDAINDIKQILHHISDHQHNPVGCVLWVPIEKVVANNYNPNNVAKKELELLYTSISHDGYTQPVVTIYDEEKDVYTIIDGFHRYFVLRTYKSLLKENNGRVPVTVIEKKGDNDCMASTIRHNRARGKHSIDGMSDIVFRMLDNGWSDSEICEELSMEAEELLRLKHITGFSKLFENAEYKKAWEHKRMIQARKQYEKENANG